MMQLSSRITSGHVAIWIWTRVLEKSDGLDTDSYEAYGADASLNGHPTKHCQCERDPQGFQHLSQPSEQDPGGLLMVAQESRRNARLPSLSGTRNLQNIRQC